MRSCTRITRVRRLRKFSAPSEAPARSNARMSAVTTDADVAGTRGSGSDRGTGGVLVSQILLGIVVIGLWEWAGRATGSTWISQPSSIGARLLQWAGSTLWRHV